jgi:hypothetical protein
MHVETGSHDGAFAVSSGICGVRQYSLDTRDASVDTVCMSTLSVGAVVKYGQPEPGEEAFRFTVVELRGGRVLLRVLGWPNPILAPTEVVLLSDVVPVSEEM